MPRSIVMPPSLATPYGKGLLGHGIVGASCQLLIKDDCANTYHKIAKGTQVTMPVCPSDWASNDFAPFGPETYRRAANQRKYIREKFQRNCWFTRKDGALYITFNAYHVAHKEIEWFKRVFFLDDQPHTFHDVGV